MRWEYKILDSREVEGGGWFTGKRPEAIEEYLNALGREGWEIVNLDFLELENRRAFLGVAKRPLDPA